jgi:ribonuclease HII
MGGSTPVDNRAMARFFFEHSGKSYRAIIGVDEVGRGALFGPVTVGAVLLTPEKWDALPQEEWFSGVGDSKLVSEKKRNFLAPLIAAALPSAVSHTAVSYIDAHNINRAVERGIYKTVQRLLRETGMHPGEVRVLFDGKSIPAYPQVGLALPMPHLSAEIKADQKYFPVSAASILAKVARDAMVSRAALRFPQYGLDAHAGYGTEIHRAAIHKFGRTLFHRKSFGI